MTVWADDPPGEITMSTCVWATSLDLLIQDGHFFVSLRSFRHISQVLTIKARMMELIIANLGA